MLSSSLVTSIALPGTSDGAADAADACILRSNASGTLAESIQRLEGRIAPLRATLQSGELPPPKHFRGDEQDVGKLTALKYIAVLIKQKGSMLYDEATDLCRHKREQFLSSLNGTDGTDAPKGEMRVPAPEWRKREAGHELLARLPLTRVPLGSFGSQGGTQQSLLLPTMSGLSDADLLLHTEMVLEAHAERKAALDNKDGPAFDAAPLRLLIDALPPSSRAAVQYLLVKVGGGEWGAELGMSVAQVDRLVCRFDKVCSEELPAAMRAAEVSLVTGLARRASVTEVDVARACSPRARLARYREMVKQDHVLRDDRLVTSRKLHERYPEMLELLRAAVAANTDVSFKARGDTPIDAMIIEKEALRGAGGQKERFARFLNASLASRGIKISPDLIPRLVKTAGIIAGGVKKVKDTAKIGAKYVAKGVQTQRQIQSLLSAYGQRVGLDQMKNLKCNTDANSANMTGNRSMYQLRDERALTHSHGVGGDHLCKLGCEALLLEGVSEGGVKLPEDFDLRKYVPAYSTDKYFKTQKALAHMFIHIQEREPESAFRDFADLSELVSRFPHRFMTPELKAMPFVFIERDNAHGVSTIETRFAAVLFSVLHGIHYLSMMSQEAGRSRWHRVETLNGAAARGLTGTAFDLPMNIPENAPDAVKHAAQDELRQQVVEEFPMTYRAMDAEDGFLSAEVPRSTSLACGFEWRTSELRAFVEAAKKGPGAMHAFLADPESLAAMPAFVHPLGYAGVLTRVWRLLHATGPLRCTKLTAHSFEYLCNAANTSCPLPDEESKGAVGVLEAIFKLDGLDGSRDEGAEGDGFLPQPRRSRWRSGLEYANIDEVLSRGGATAVDEFYPKRLLEQKILPSKPKLLDDFARNGNTLPTAELTELTEVLVVDQLTLYAELAERSDKEQYKKMYEAMKSRQEGDGTLEYVAALAAGLLGKPENAPATWPHITELKDVIKKLPGKVKMPMNPKKAVLIALIAKVWRGLPELQRPTLLFTGRVWRLTGRVWHLVPVWTGVAPSLAPAPARAASAAADSADSAAVALAAAAAAAAAAAVVLAAAAAAAATTTTTAAPALPPAPAPPPPRAEEELLQGAESSAAEDLTDEEDAERQEEAQWQEEAAAAEAFVETVLETMTKKCGRCYGWFAEAEMVWDDAPYCFVCRDGAACAARQPGAGGRKRQRLEQGGYQSLARGGSC